MDPIFELRIDPAAKGARNATAGLYHQLKAAIADGRLRGGARMPGTRKAEAFFGISRNTAAEVYERLLREGYLVARRGSGTYVTDAVPLTTGPAEEVPADIPDPALPDARLNAFWLRPETTAAMYYWQDNSPANACPGGPVADLRPALVDLHRFPYPVFRKVLVKQLRDLEKRPPELKSPQGNQGNYVLRDAICRHIALTRAVPCQAGDIVVTSGAQQAFDLLARTLVTPGKTVVAVEDPGYPAMRVPFAAAGAKLVPVRVDDEGLVVDDLPLDTGVICVTPSHQFPLGTMMSARRRQALVAFARRVGAVIIEDDYDGEFRYDGSPLTALRTAGDADVVFYVGTFSKCMLPSLRLGFVVAPSWALKAMIVAKNALDWHCSTPLQKAVAGFIDDGHLDRHIRRMRTLYRQRRQLLLSSLRGEFTDWLEAIPSFYGVHVTGVAKPSVDIERVAGDLAQRGVKVHTLRRYSMELPARSGVIFGFGTADLPEIRAGLGELHRVLSGG